MRNHAKSLRKLVRKYSCNVKSLRGLTKIDEELKGLHGNKMREFTSSTKVICGHMRLELKLLFSSTFAVITPGWCWRPYELLLSSNRLKRTTRSSGKQCFRVNTCSIVFQNFRLCWKCGECFACFRKCCLGTKRNRRRKYSIENLVLFPGHYTNCCWVQCVW